MASFVIMLAETIVHPKDIEKELKTIWESFEQRNKMRASLFTLIVYTKLSDRTDYYRLVVQKLIEKFPCRILFITSDPDQEKRYLKTAVSVIAPQEKNSQVACDHIDIGVAGQDDIIVPFIVLPHLLPDLPVYLLWGDAIETINPLFQSLAKLATKLIFDSEEALDIFSFINSLQQCHEKKKDISDLNWARTENWRHLLSSFFQPSEKLAVLNKTKTIHLIYNCLPSKFFCRSIIKPLFLHSWIATSLNWKFDHLEKIHNSIRFSYRKKSEETAIYLTAEEIPFIAPGSIQSIRITSQKDHHFIFSRAQKDPHLVSIESFTSDRCELPTQFPMEKAVLGRSLVKEIFHRDTSLPFLEALKNIQLTSSFDLC